MDTSNQTFQLTDYQKLANNYLLSRFRFNYDERQDIIQIGLIAFWKDFDRINKMEKPLSYLFQVTQSHALQYIRRNKKLVHLEDEVWDTLKVIDEQDYSSENEEKIYNMLCQFLIFRKSTEDIRKDFFVHGLKVEEICQKYNYKKRKVEGAVLNARKKLRKLCLELGFSKPKDYCDYNKGYSRHKVGQQKYRSRLQSGCIDKPGSLYGPQNASRQS